MTTSSSGRTSSRSRVRRPSSEAVEEAAGAAMARDLNVLCAGAVKGLVLALQDGFERSAGVRIQPTFGAVGALRDALRAGAPCDVFIATDAMVESLQASGELDAGPRRAIGSVQTAIAVPSHAH